MADFQVFTGKQVREYNELVRNQRGRRTTDRLPRAQSDSPEETTVAFVVLTSTLPFGDFYPAHYYSYDTNAKTWTQQATAWVIDPNDGDLDTATKYPAELLGIAQHLTANAYTTSLGASFTVSGSTLTMSGNGAIGPYDGMTLADGDRILFNPGDSNTGVYKLTQGTASTPAVLTLVDAGPFVKVTAGTTYANTVWSFDVDGETYEQATSPPADLDRGVWAVLASVQEDNLPEMLSLFSLDGLGF